MQLGEKKCEEQLPGRGPLVDGEAVGTGALPAHLRRCSLLCPDAERLAPVQCQAIHCF